MTRDEALEIVALLVAHYPAQAKLAPENVKAFVANLTCYPADLGHRAAERVVRASTFFPSVAELVTEIVELAMGLPSPESAWLLVLERARTDDWTTSFAKTTDGAKVILASLRAAGGSYAIKNQKTHLVRKAFLESYTAARKDFAERLREHDLPAIERERQKAITQAPPATSEEYTAAREANDRNVTGAAKAAG